MPLIRKFFSYLPHFIQASSLAFLINICLYVLLKPKIGVNAGGLIAELTGTLFLYIFLRLSKKPKLFKTSSGIVAQYLISIGTIFINLVVLNVVNFVYQSITLSSPSFASISETKVSILSKIVASICGFLWTSSMTMKFTFDFRNNKGDFRR